VLSRALAEALEQGERHGVRQAPPVAAVAVDAAGHEQPLHLVLTPDGVRRLLEAFGPGDADHVAARRLVRVLNPLRVTVPGQDSWDVDTRDQLQAWRLREASATLQVVGAVRALVHRPSGPGRDRYPVRPLVVALDGRSGAGKSVLAQAVALHTGGCVLEGDDFYAPRLDREGLAAAAARSAAELADDGVIDWRRLRSEALEPLAAGRPARYHPYDWESGDGRLLEREVVVRPAPVVIVDGVYSARPELADLVHLRVLVSASDDLRARRILERGDEDETGWPAVWASAEQHYFTHVSPPGGFDLHVTND
jgi:uridine kinase